MEGEQESHMDQIRWTETKLGAEVAPLEQRSFSVKSLVQQCNKKRFHFHIRSKYLFYAALFSSFQQRSLRMTQLFKNQSHSSCHGDQFIIKPFQELIT